MCLALPNSPNTHVACASARLTRRRVRLRRQYDPTSIGQQPLASHRQSESLSTPSLPSPAHWSQRSIRCPLSLEALVDTASRLSRNHCARLRCDCTRSNSISLHIICPPRPAHHVRTSPCLEAIGPPAEVCSGVIRRPKRRSWRNLGLQECCPRVGSEYARKKKTIGCPCIRPLRQKGPERNS